MAPTPQEYSLVTEKVAVNPQNGNNIVISGMSGLYPQSRYIKDFEKILYDKINPITTEGVRWQYNHPEAEQYGGIVPGLDRFDANFFKVHYRLGSRMDAMARKILELAYEAIYDAGVNPHDLSGKKVGVYIGTCFSESVMVCFYMEHTKSGLGIAGSARNMFANRISYWLNVKGPSMSIDEAGCSSTAALKQAYLGLSKGECEAAIVGGAYLCLHPQSSVHCSRVMNLSKNGTTKSFDQYAEGCARSEAVNVLFLQKANDALRIYAHVKHVKSEFRNILEDKTGPKFGFYRNPADTELFIKAFYEEARIPPQLVEYVEAHGSAVLEADKSELEAISKLFCESRSEPLLVGSVMSNIGYGEAASGISAITKVLLGYHRGILAGNLHCETPRTDVSALREGRMKVLTDHHQFRGTYAAINSMSVTGINAHVLLHGHNKPKNLNRYKSGIPRLVTISGRQESSVQRVLNLIKSNPVDVEQLALLNKIHKSSVAGHLGRGYIVLDTNENKETMSLSEKACNYDNVRRPLWFVYSGMGSQWAGMGVALMRLPVFAMAIDRCHQALKPKGLNIVDIITSSDSTTFDNILHSFVSIAAVQIGLTDVLKQLKLVPDGIIGHSVGELGCAYADGCLTAEEMILSAYSRGLVSLETKFIRGSMAAVGLGCKQVSNMCPPEIEVACHNSSESSTISGPEDVMRDFIAKLTSQDIFAKEVPCSHIAYHSRYIAGAGPGLLKYLKEVIQNPRERSERWVSTSVPKDRWNEPMAKFSSAEYHTNNFLNPVLFEETSKLIPSDAVLVEVAPHGLLQAILKRSLPESCVNVALTRRGHPDNVLLVLEAIGQLYMEGFNIDLQSLYPKVEFPVSTGTPFLSDFVGWAHEEKWLLPLYSSARRNVAASCKYIISINDDDYSYLNGHVIRQKILLPSAFVLVAVWDTLAMVLGLPKKEFNVKFDDIRFYSQPVLHGQRQIRLNVALHRGSGRFEVLDDYSKIASGFIKNAHEFKFNKISDPRISQTSMRFSSQDVYKLFKARDFNYSEEFRSICCINDDVTESKLFWNDNWVTLIDGLIQLNVLKQAYHAVSRPDRIRSLTINVNRHMDNVETINGTKVIPAQISDVYDLTRCGGIVITGLKFHYLPNILGNEVTLKTKRFVPRFQSNGEILSALEVFCQIAAENINRDNVKVIHIVDRNKSTVVAKYMKDILENNIDGLELKYNVVNKNDISQVQFNDVDIVIIQNLSNDDNLCKSLYKMLPTQTFLINEEDMSEATARARPSSLYSVVAVNNNIDENVRLELIRWRSTPLSSVSLMTITIRLESDLAVLVNARNSLMPQSGLIIVTCYPPPVAGLKELVKQWRREIIRNRIYLVMVKDGITKSSDIELPNVDLAVNILDNGAWGGEYYTHVNRSQETAHNVMLQSEKIGNIESLKWVDTPEIIKSGTRVKVHFAGINIDDVRKASGVKTADNMCEYSSSYGMEFSGITETGERVMGLVEDGSTRSTLVANPELTWPVPSHWSLEDAATVPLAYVYVLYCLYIKFTKNTPITPHYKFTVLIHGGAGALGQAAISVALASGYRVFTTVSDQEKKKFLLKLFPDLKEENIGCSRDARFVDMVLSSTKGKGADFVLCCLKGEIKDFSLKACALFGATIDTNQIISAEQYNLGLYHLHFEKSYITVDIRSIFSNASDIKRIRQYMSEGISGGWVRPLSRVTFTSLEAPRAFRLLAASKHRGRVLIQLTDTLKLLSTFRIVCSPHHNHLIVGDSESLILQLADRLVSGGAKHLHLHLLQSPALLHYKINNWKILDVKVKITTGEVIEENVEDIIQQAKAGGFLAGVYITNTKVELTMITNFDLATRRLAPYLRDDEFDPTQSYLWIVPGLEGHHNRFRTLCEGLKLAALVLQPGLDYLLEDTHQLATRYYKVVMKRIDVTKQFHIMGYEFGVSVALELAALLEKQGLTGTVYCIGDGPKETVEFIEGKLAKFSDEEHLQRALIEHMFKLMVGDECEYSEVENAMSGCSTWSQRVEACMRILLGRVSHSAQYARSIIDAAYSRLLTARRHVLAPKLLKSRIVLLRAYTAHAHSATTSLQEYSEQPVRVYDLPTPLARVTEDLRCTAIINRHLSKDVIDAFNERNLCESYLLNADTFIMTDISNE